MQTYDTHHELLIIPYKNGVKILRPYKSNRNNHQYDATKISDVLALSSNTYFLNRESKIVNGNLPNAQILHMSSICESIGKSLADAPYTKETVARVHNHDRQVIHHQKSLYFEEILESDDENAKTGFSIKLPIYNNTDNSILGVFGFTVVIGKQSLAQTLSAITNMGFMHSINNKIKSVSCPVFEAEEIYLTPREHTLLKLIIMGKICPEIAAEMKLSKRTVEHYTVALRNKFNVPSKQALIDKVIHLMRDYHLGI